MTGRADGQAAGTPASSRASVRFASYQADRLFETAQQRQGDEHLLCRE